MARRFAPFAALDGDSDFPGGNGVEFDRSAPDVLRFKMVKHGSPFCLWFYFRASVPVGRRVSFELVNTYDTLGRPESWSSVRVVCSYDRRRWLRLPRRDCVFDPEGKVFRFSGRFARPVVYFAQAYPYVTEELEALRQSLMRSSLLHERFAGTSGAGRPLPLWLLQARGLKGRKPLGLFLCARHHAGESHGSWALDGFLREFAFGQSRESRWLRANGSLLVAPFVDLDGVVEGMYGKDRVPVDFNRDWSAEPVRPEIRRLQRETDAWAKTVHYAAHLDFHCPCLPHVHHMHASVPGQSTARLKDVERELARELARLSPRDSRFFEKDLVFPGYQGASGETTCSAYQRHVYGVLSLTPEVAYHPLRGGGCIELPAMLRYGAAHARALARVLRRHEKEIRARSYPFYDPFEQPLASAIAEQASAYRRWGILGGQAQQFASARVQGPDGAQVEALVIRSNSKRGPFVITPLIPLASLKRSLGRPGLFFRTEGVGKPRRNATPRGLVVYVFYYDRRLRRFGGLYGSAVYELPLEGARSRGWQAFRSSVPVPKGAAYAKLGIRSELSKGKVLVLTHDA